MRRKTVPFEPLVPGKVGMYVCGPTPYAPAHIGHAFSAISFDTIRRSLTFLGFDVNYIRNVTDVEDKIIRRANEVGEDPMALAARFAADYNRDMARFGVLPPTEEPKVSTHIPQIIALIERLIARGHAYPLDGDVYYEVRTFPAYGKLSDQNIDKLRDGARVEVDERKRDPADFALWKAHKPGEDTAWEAPWGRGRPGWHIECSAMAEEILGVGFEIHGGGADLIFPHHENEAAQTCAAHGVPLAQLWVHNGMVRLDQAKMSKSVGNIFLLYQALDAYGRDALIMYFCGGHYRQPVEFDDERLTEARARVERIEEAARRLTPGPSPAWSAPLHERFFDSLADDFNTPAALAAVFEWVREANRGEPGAGNADLRDMLGVLALDNLLDVAAVDAPAEVVELSAARERARAARDYAEADRLRDEIRGQGWEVRDGPDGPELLPAA